MGSWTRLTSGWVQPLKGGGRGLPPWGQLGVGVRS